MAKRERNWQSDIYDLTTDRVPPAAAVELVVASGASTDPDAARPVVVRTAAPARSPSSGDNEALLGLLAGAVVGAALTLLVAPSSGARLRARLRGRVDTGV